MSAALSWLVVAGAFLVEPVAAQEYVTPPDLPSTELARTWLDQDADVREALAGLGIAAQEARQLRVSPNEWTVRYQRNSREYEAGGPNSHEWAAQLERTMRLPNKRSIDLGLATGRESLAQADFGEALHESARSLVDLWMAWQEATELQNLLDEQVRVAQENVRAVDARLRGGDAARLELNLAQADAADVERRMSEMRVEQSKSQIRFETRFGAELSVPPAAVAPEPISETQEMWKERIVEQSDELTIARLQLEQARKHTARAKADRLPDPTLGVYAASEVFHDEQILGFTVSVPIPGRYRSSRAAQAFAEAEAAEARLARTEREIATRIAETYADAVGSFERWRLAEGAAQKTAEGAQLTRRAYTLGETDVQVLILARRQALDAAVTAVQARIAARRAHSHLLVDAHLIWDLHHE